MFNKENIPNILTISRGILTLVLLFLFNYSFPNQFTVLYIIFIIASLTDFLDGQLARRWKVVSEFGKVFDPLFDKILVLGLFMLLIPYDVIPIYILILLFFRELIVGNFRAYLLSRGVVIQAIKTAKIKMVFQVLMLHSVFLALVFPGNEILDLLLFVFTALAFFFSYISGVKYTQIFIKNFKKING